MSTIYRGILNIIKISFNKDCIYHRSHVSVKEIFK